MYSLGALVKRVDRRARALRWLGIPLLAVGLVLTALWVFPVAEPTVRIRWANEIDAAQLKEFERERSLVNGTLREDGSWAYLLEDTSRTNVALIVQTPIVDGTAGIDRDRFEVPPAVVRPLFGLAPLQSFLGLGLGGLLLAGSAAATRRRRTVYAAVALALLLVGMVTAPLPLHVTDDKGEWMGDFQNMTQDRDRFDIASGYTSIPFPHHLTALVLKSLDAALGATAESPVRAFRWLSALAGGLFVAELLGIAMLEGWSAGALRYLALCVAAPVTLLFFGFSRDRVSLAECRRHPVAAAGVLGRGAAVERNRGRPANGPAERAARIWIAESRRRRARRPRVGRHAARPVEAGGCLRGLGHGRVARLAGLVSGGTQAAGRAGARRQYCPAPARHAVRRGQPDCGSDSVGVRYPGHRRDRGRRGGFRYCCSACCREA